MKQDIMLDPFSLSPRFFLIPYRIIGIIGEKGTNGQWKRQDMDPPTGRAGRKKPDHALGMTFYGTHHVVC